MKNRNALNVLFYSFPIWFILIGLMFLYVSGLPFEDVESFIDSLSPDRHAAFFSDVIYSNMTDWFRITAFALLLAGFGLFWKRRLIATFFLSAHADFSALLHDFKSLLQQFSTKERVALALIIAVGLGLRLLFLWQPVRFDEAYTYLTFASKPFVHALSIYSDPNNHLFHTFFVKLSVVLFGNHVWALRLPVLFFGVLLIPLSFLFTRVLFSETLVALLTAALVATSAELILYSVNARGYIIIAFITLCMILLSNYLLHKPNIAAWLIFSLFASLGLYTIPVMIYSYALVVGWFTLSLFTQTKTLRFPLLLALFCSIALTLFLTLILYLPVFSFSGVAALVSNPYVLPLTFPQFFSQIANNFPMIETWQLMHRDIPLVIQSILFAGFLMSAVFYSRIPQPNIPIYIGFLIFIFPIVLAQRVIPYPRTWLFTFPIYLSYASAGIVFGFKILSRKSIKIDRFYVSLVFSIMLSLSISLFCSQSIKVNRETSSLISAEEITQFLKEYLKPGDRVFSVCPSGAPLAYYFARDQLPSNILLWESLSKAHTFPNRLILVVNTIWHSLETVIEEAHLNDHLYDHPKLLKRFDSADVYVVERIADPNLLENSFGLN